MKVERIIRICENFGVRVQPVLKISAKKTTFFLKKSAFFRHFFGMFVIFIIKSY